MKPNEFWNSTYKEIIVFCNANLAKIMDDKRTSIEICEAFTDKLIVSNPMCVKSPKTLKIKNMFKNLFNQEKKEQTLDEQIKILRRMIK